MSAQDVVPDTNKSATGVRLKVFALGSTVAVILTALTAWVDAAPPECVTYDRAGMGYDPNTHEAYITFNNNCSTPRNLRVCAGGSEFAPPSGRISGGDAAKVYVGIIDKTFEFTWTDDGTNPCR